jgi:hypothetical protein
MRFFYCHELNCNFRERLEQMLVVSDKILRHLQPNVLLEPLPEVHNKHQLLRRHLAGTEQILRIRVPRICTQLSSLLTPVSLSRLRSKADFSCPIAQNPTVRNKIFVKNMG